MSQENPATCVVERPRRRQGAAQRCRKTLPKPGDRSVQQEPTGFWAQPGSEALAFRRGSAPPHSFFRYLALREPEHAAVIQRVLAMPSKRYARRPIDFLTRAEMEALLAVPDRTAWAGRRDHALLLLALQTGLRVSELIGLRCEDVVLGPGAHVRCRGKGRKERCTPLRRDAVATVRLWLRERRGHPEDPLLPTTRGGPMSRDAVEHLLAKYTAMAQQRCPCGARPSRKASNNG
jgi:site-specific recombinase XerD